MILQILNKLWSRARKPVISVFILFHILALLMWISPPFPLYWSVLPAFRPYICYLGFWNQWKMFCSPKNWSMYLTANVTMNDGQVLPWSFPRMENLDYLTRMQKERYRKWAHEYVNEKKFEFVCPDACRFIARNLSNGTRQVAQVQLIRHWTWIQSPIASAKPMPAGESSYPFYTYMVKPEDLK